MTSKAVRIGEIARAVGVSPDTLRHYERKGLLSRVVRSDSGYRLYTPDVIQQVGRIRGALAVGFTLDEIARVFAARDRGGAPCHQVRSMAAEKLESLEQHIAEMMQLKRYLQRVIRRWDTMLERTPPGQKAHLLETLSVPTNRNRKGRHS